MSQEKAEKLKPKERWALISITDPGGDRSFRYKWKSMLELEFLDIEAGKDSFGKRHAKSVLNFLEDLPKDTNYLAVHCMHGQSRSAAVAKFSCDYFGLGTFPEDYDDYNDTVYETLTKYWMSKEQQDKKSIKKK